MDITGPIISLVLNFALLKWSEMDVLFPFCDRFAAIFKMSTFTCMVDDPGVFLPLPSPPLPPLLKQREKNTRVIKLLKFRYLENRDLSSSLV